MIGMPGPPGPLGGLEAVAAELPEEGVVGHEGKLTRGS